MSRTVCFISKEDGRVATCTIEGLDDEQIKEKLGSKEIKCENCPTKKKHEGEEKEKFTYTAWTGEI